MVNQLHNQFFITSWDDGNRLDMYLSQLLKEYNIPAIFFIPNISDYTSLSIDNLKELVRNGFEIGGHTRNHLRSLPRLTYKNKYREIKTNKECLEEAIGKEIKWFSYPHGYYDNETIRILKKVGYEYARTTEVFNITKPDNAYEVHPTIHVYPRRKEYNQRSWCEVAVELWDKAIKEKNGYFHLFGHSWECEKYNTWEDLEKFFKYITT